MHPCRVGHIRWQGQKRRAVGHKRQHVINRRLRVLPTCPEWLCLSRRARDTAATILHHSRHRVESATKTIKFFVAHTVNYVICNNHTRIDWVLLNFTPVIQQNYHQPGRKFEKLFCAVDRLSCLSTWVVKIQNQQIQKRSCFWYCKLCAFNLLSWGLNVVLKYLTSSDFCVAQILWARNMPESSRFWQHFYAVFIASTETIFCPTSLTILRSVYIYWDDILSHFPDDFWRNLSSDKAQTD